MDGRIIRRSMAVLFAAALCITLFRGGNLVKAFTSDRGDGTFSNPVIFSDVPDEDIIRVGKAYYMISTTMHMSPGAPIMRSYDLVNWEIVNYVYDYLEEDDARSLKNGKSDYAYGSWAASLRYDQYQKRFYVTFSSQTTPKSYFFVTDDIENGSWHRSETEKCYDSSFLFVDTGTECKKYMIIPVSKQGTKADGSKYSYNQTEMCDLIVNEDTWDVTLGDERTLLIDNNNYENPPAGLAAEGVHAYKIGEYYYFFMIQGAGNPVRQQICWRSKTLEHGSFEVKKVFTGGIVDAEGKTVNSSWGVAQGGIVQTLEGEWYSIMFQDYHSVGRIPVLVPVSWGEDGWPIFGNGGKSVDQVLPIPVSGQEKKSIVQSEEFDNGTTRRIYDEVKKGTGITAGIPVDELEAGLDRVEDNEYGYNGSNLKPVWQWNHNPNNNLWSLTDREGYLRLKSGLISKNIREARNTLTQRTFGPTSGAVTIVEVGYMREGDVAGLAAFQNQYGFVGVKMENGRKYLVMHRAEKMGDAAGKEIEMLELAQDRIYLKVNCDFRENRKLNQTWRMKDEAYFYYSLDGEHWTQIGDTLKMSYDWPDFMGYRFGLFYYSTKNCGGYVDFDSFQVGSVDGKRAELQKLIEAAESIQRQPAHTDHQWEEFTQAIAGAREAVKDLPEEESEMDLREIERNNSTAYVAIQRLERAVETVSKAAPSETETPAPLETLLPSPSLQTPAPRASVSMPPQGRTDIHSNRIVIRAAGYPLIKKGMYLVKGSKVSLRAEVLPTHASQRTVTFTSDKKNVVSVSSKGVVKAVKTGKTKITIAAMDGGAKAVLPVQVVKKKKVNQVLKAAKSTLKVRKGGKAELQIKKLTAKTTNPVTYKSLNKKIAPIDQYGRITGNRKGNTKIKAVCGSKTIMVKVKVV